MADAEIVIGTTADDTLSAGATPATLYGRGGDDTLYGPGNLYGEDGNDLLRGADGNDVLWGGAGDDDLLAKARQRRAQRRPGQGPPRRRHRSPTT